MWITSLNLVCIDYVDGLWNFISKPQFSKLYPQGESVSKKKETIFISRPNISMQFDTSQSKKPKGEYYLHL